MCRHGVAIVVDLKRVAQVGVDLGMFDGFFAAPELSFSLAPNPMRAAKSDAGQAKLVSSRSITSVRTQTIVKMPGSKALGALRWLTHGSNGLVSSGFEQSGVCTNFPISMPPSLPIPC
jgi:hypothetical protein